LYGEYPFSGREVKIGLDGILSSIIISGSTKELLLAEGIID
jgi:hypothetical protein